MFGGNEEKYTGGISSWIVDFFKNIFLSPLADKECPHHSYVRSSKLANRSVTSSRHQARDLSGRSVLQIHSAIGRYGFAMMEVAC